MEHTAEDVVTLRSCHRPASVRVPHSDVDGCMRVSLWRAFLTLLSIVLVITDIPRTGLSLSPSDYYPRAGPGSVTCWGPYEYAVAHLKSVNGGPVSAFSDGQSMDELEVWSYKFDSLSIPPRAIASHLNVASFPPCILYVEACTTPKLAPATVFHMFDDLVSALQTTYFEQPQLERRPFVFFTKSNWIDRLHQFVFRYLTRNPEIRLHSVFHRSSRGQSTGLNAHGLCNSPGMDPQAYPHESRPIFCEHHISWKCDHPIEPTGERKIPIWDHIALRVDELQRRYSHLELDMTVVTSSVVEKSHRDRNVIRTVSYLTDALEITTLVRGRQCSGDGNCSTVFVDDFRYERVVLETDEDVWRPYVRVLRAGSQLYMWLRVLLLVWGSYRACAAESAHRRTSGWRLLTKVCRTVLKIPGHTIVYGSWMPIVGYGLAHLFDSALIHMMAEYEWSSINGFYDFNPVDYVFGASIQMRNLWMNVAFWKLVLMAWKFLTTRCQHTSHPERRGVLAFRSGWIGLISWLTTFSLARSLTFRDTNVVKLVELPRHVPVSAMQRMETFQNFADYGLRFDLKASFAATLLVFVTTWSVSTAIKVVTGRVTSLLVCRSFYVPLTAGRVWLRSTIDTYWSFSFRRPQGASATRIEPTTKFISGILELHTSTLSFHRQKNGSVHCKACSQLPTPLHWRSAQGCQVHEPIFILHRRTKELSSMVRLTNIAAMTDPIVLFQLYVIGQTLYLYWMPSNSDLHTADHILLPIPPFEKFTRARPSVSGQSHATQDSKSTRSTSSALEFVGILSSRDAPWHVLILEAGPPVEMARDGTHKHEVPLRCGRNWITVRVPPTDIDACIIVPRWRAVITCVCLLLAVTDIPRTGLAFNKTGLFHDTSDVGAGVVMYWGPYEDHSAYLSLAQSGARRHATAFRDGEPLDAINEWLYKYDTQSIGLRGAAEYFNVSAYLPCLLYRSQCPSSQLDPTSVFDMLDNLLAAFISNRASITGSEPNQSFAFCTRSNWFDSLHHVFFGYFMSTPDIRLHTIHRIPFREGTHNPLCSLNGSLMASPNANPRICDLANAWMCDNPDSLQGEQRIAITEHIGNRLLGLQRRHQNLSLDVTVLSTTLHEQSRPNVIPTVRVLAKTDEVITLIRGRRCLAPDDCETVFIDDFRYERSWIESDAADWVGYVSALRGVSQLYLWVRIGLLLGGCYLARVSEPKHRSRGFITNLVGSCHTVLKVPSHIVVYGSWIPITGYALAHCCDSALIQGIGEYAFASVGGMFHFDPIAYTLKISLQMRNLWMIAFLWKLAFVSINATQSRSIDWKDVQRDGLLTFRGNWIGIISYLTTFGLMRAIRFRNTRVVSVHDWPAQVDLEKGQLTPPYQNFSEYGIAFDIKCMAIASAITIGVVCIVKMTIRAITRRDSSYFTCRTSYIPLSAGRLWSWSTLFGSWVFNLRPPITRVIALSSVKVDKACSTHAESSKCHTCRFIPSLIHWRSVQGCPIHEPIFDVQHRSKEIWSMIRLTNLAAMTDPIVLLRLYTVGVPLYVYRMYSGAQERPYLILLPTPPKRNAVKAKTRQTAWAPVLSGLKYVASVNSRDVPWHVLVSCG